MAKLSQKPELATTLPIQRVKLISVKRGMYNPHLSTYKRYEIDSFMSKLADEHARTSVPINTEFPNNPFYQYDPPSTYIPGYERMTFLKEIEWKDDPCAAGLMFLDNPQLPQSLVRFKKNVPLGESRLIHIPTIRKFKFFNYNIRYLKPEIRSAWRAALPKKALPQPVRTCKCNIQNKS